MADDARKTKPSDDDGRQRSTTRRPTLPPRPSVPLKLQVGLAHGEIVEMSGDVFGDAVNVAARLLDHAGDNETLATSSVVEQLGEWERSRFRSLDRMQLRGRVEPVHVYLQEAVRRFGDTAATAYGDMLLMPSRARRHPPGLARPEPHLRRHQPAGRSSAAARRRPTSSTTTASRARTRGSTGTAAPSSWSTSATTAPTSASTTTPRSSACAAAPARCTAAA